MVTEQTKLPAPPPKDIEGQVPELYKAFGPLLKSLAKYIRLIPLPGIRERYEFLAIKGVLMVVAAGFALLVYFALIQNLLIVAALVFAGFLLPDMRLSDSVRKRKQTYLRALPTFLDLLALAVEAGLGFDAAVRKLTEVLEPSPLTWGVQVLLRSMSVGRPRSEALREMAERLNLPDFTSFAHAVIQATESGASMGPVLRIQSNEMTFRRFERAEKQAAELPVKMLFPLFAFIFPATFLMIIGPLYFQIKASGVDCPTALLCARLLTRKRPCSSLT